MLPIPLVVLRDLTWWRRSLAVANGIHFFQGDEFRSQIHLFTDASSIKGYGGFWYTCHDYSAPEAHTLCSHWNLHASSLPQGDLFAASHLTTHPHAHINVLEILAITKAFMKWGPAWQHSSVHVHTDNTVALAALQNAVAKGPANLLLRQLLIQAATWDINLKPSWISTHDNGLADAISRFDWPTVATLCPQVNVSALMSSLSQTP